MNTFEISDIGFEAEAEKTPCTRPMRRSALLSCGQDARVPGILDPRVVSVEEWVREGVDGDVVGVDFETYYTGSYSVKEMGTWAYCRDPRFHAYLVAVSDGARTCVCHPEDFPWGSIAGLEWVSHNREFDRYVFERVWEDFTTKDTKGTKGDGVLVSNFERRTLNVELRNGRPGQDGDLEPRTAGTDADLVEGVVQQRSAASTVWHCSAALCAYLQLSRDLAGAVEEVFGVKLDKGVRAKARGRSEGRGQRSGELELGLDMDRGMILYAARDAVACLALWDRLESRWPERERRLFELTCAMGRRGLAMDWDHVVESRLSLLRKVEGLKASLPWSPSLSIPKFKTACKTVGVNPPKSTAVDDPGFLEWLERNGDNQAGAWARTVQAVRSANRTEKVLGAMEARKRPEVRGQKSGVEERPPVPCRYGDRRALLGRMVYELKYCGANTARWSGGGGLNVQNLNRSEAEGVDLRRAIVAPPGHVMAVVDYAQIESRMLLYLAGDQETLTLLREHPEMDVYEVHARATMKYSEEETLKAYCARTGSTLRHLAKARVLGLGFGCGKDKFVSVAKSMAGLDLSLEDSGRIVREYRESNLKVVGLWHRLENACRVKVGGDYVLPLPCTQWDRGYGRFLIYRDVRFLGRELRCRVGGQDTGVYGGLLAENFTQATARDVLAEAWLRCADAGFVPVLSVHDELVFELPVETAEADLSSIVELMEAPMPWATGLPLKAEGTLMNFYQK